MLRRLATVLAISGLAPWSAPARAATVKKVSKDKTKVLILLNKAEMAALEEDQEVVVEIGTGTDRFVVSGVLQKLNPVKQTVVLELAAAGARFEKNQAARFLSAYWNVVSSPEIVSLAQYHQFGQPFAEASAGYFYEQLGERTAETDTRRTSLLSGTHVTARTYIPVNAQWFGASFGMSRTDARQKRTTEGVGAELKSGTTRTVLRPSGWVGAPDGFRVGVEYDYTMLQETVGTGSSQLRYDFALGQPFVSAVYATKDAETGFGYRAKDRATSVDSGVANGVAFRGESTTKADQEVVAFYRSVSSPVFIWGLRGGFLLADRANGKGAPLDRTFKPWEVGHLATSFEHRRRDGSKIDWGLFLAGSKVPSREGFARGVNALGLKLTYQTLVGGGIVVGGTGELYGGNLKIPNEGEDGSSYDTVIAGAGASIALFAHVDFDVLGKSGRRR